MRFLAKQQLRDLDKEAQYLPVASKADEDTYESNIPRNFLEKSVRIFCRSPKDKGDAIRTLFEKWLIQKGGSDKRFSTLSQP